MAVLGGRQRLLLLAAGLAAAFLLFLAGCSGGPKGGGPVPTSSAPLPSSASPTPSPTPSPVGLAPLTGLPVSSALVLSLPAVGVAIGLVPGAPVVGLGAADIVYQEFDVSGHSRLVAVYQSTDATSIGPVTATAPVDVRLLQLFRTPTYAFAGGPSGFVMQAKLPFVNPRSSTSWGQLFRGGLVTGTAALRSSARAASAALAGVLSFASPGAPAPSGGPALRKLTVSVPGQAVEVFTWIGTGWAGPGGTLLSNVVIEYVKYKSLTPHKSVTMGSAQVVGTGAATVVAGQHAVAGTWTRPFPRKVTSYTVNTMPVGLVPGRTWVLLVPAGTRLVGSP